VRAVNLLPRDQAQRTIKKESLPILIGACSGVLVLAVLGAMFMMGSGKVAAQQRKVDDLNRVYQALPPPPAGPSAAQQQLAGEQSARVSALSTALTSRVAWDRVFREFSLVLPEDVWLTTLTAKSPISPVTNAPTGTGTATGPPSQFTIQGRTYSHDGVARLLSRLQVVPDLTNVQLLSSTRSKVGGQDVVDFSIAADIKVTGAPGA
jgi:Tfp pilus assembly protein PilN